MSVSFSRIVCRNLSFREGLDGFYIALGGCFDFIAFSLIPNVPEGTKQEYLSVYPFLGYKIRIFKWLSADFFCGYKKVFLNADEEAKKKLESYIGSGVKVGVSLRFHFSSSSSLECNENQF